MSRRGVVSRTVRVLPIACAVAFAIAMLSHASPGPGWLSPWKSFLSSNDFLTSGTPLNGAMTVTSPPWNGVRSGQDPAGYLARARLSNPAFGLGDFTPVFNMSEFRHGAGTVIARGPALMEQVRQATPSMSPPRDTVSYQYIVGGMAQGVVSATIERAEIDADGNVFPALEAQAGLLMTARYGAAVVARGDSIYVIGGYGSNGHPVQTIERFRIDARGYLGDPVWQAAPGWGGDVSAVIVNGWLYVMGGSDGPRGPAEAVLPWIERAPIDPRGNLGTFEEIRTVSSPAVPLHMPVGVAGGRAVVVAGWESNQPVHSIYYLGGNVGNTANGASRNVFRLKVASDDTIPGGWTSIPHNTDLVQLVDPRELFAAVATNGYLYVVGGETTMQGMTTYYSLVERAAVGADGTIGPFVRLDGTNSTYINGYNRASDIQGAVLNNHIYVPGGRDAWGIALNQIFNLSLDQGGISLLPDPVLDTSVFNMVSDLGGDRGIHSIAFDIGPDPAGAAGIRVRFRSSTAEGAWSGWTPYFSLAKLPPEYAPHTPISGEAPFLLDLGYAHGVSSCLDANLVPNPTNRTGPITARYMEYEVIIPEGGAGQKLHRIALDPRPLGRFALPGGYDPATAGGPYPPSCAPVQAIADMGVTDGWVRFKGAAFDDPDFVLNPNTIKLVPSGTTIPITVKAVEVKDRGETIDVKVDIGSGTGGPFTYDLVYAPPGTDPVTLLSPAIKVHPAPALENSRSVPGLDVHPGNSVARENVLEAPTPQAVRAKFQVALFGDHFRSGRVDDTGPLAVDDSNGPSAWPVNPFDPTGQVSVIRYKVEDPTASNNPSFKPLKLWNLNAGDWKEVPRGEFLGATSFTFDLEVDTRAKSGPHDLLITVQNPQLGRTVTVTQTVYVVPAFGVTRFQNNHDPTPDPNPGAGNRYDWSGSNNPAVADLGDGVGTGPLTIDVTGFGFQSDSGKSLVPAIAPVLSAYAPHPGGHNVLDPDSLTLPLQVPSNTVPRLHDFTFDWSYQLPANPNDIANSDPQGSVAPAWNGPMTINRTWTTPSGSWIGLYVVPPRVRMQSILGSHNTNNPIMVLQSDPTLTINGDGFATQGPSVGGFASTLYGARLISMANSPAEDIHPMPGELHMVSDCQARLTMNVTGSERPGQMYALEMTTYLPDLASDPDALARSRARTPYSLDESASIVTVLPLPVCTTVAPLCLRVDQGTSLSQMVVKGRNFDMGTTVDLGPGITIQNLQVCHDNAACPAEDTLTFDAVVSPAASPGSRLLQIDNGPTGGMSLRTSCATDFWVVPKPTVSLVQPSEIQQPPMAPGTRTAPVDIFGTNFVSGAGIQVTLANGTPTGNVTVKPPVVVVDSGHITAELVVSRAVTEGDYKLKVTEPSGPTCGTSSVTAEGSFKITPFREISVTAVSNQGTGCQGRSGTLAVTGTNFKDPAGGALVGSASLGPGVSVDSMVVNSQSSLTISYSISDGAGLGQKSLVLNPVTAGATPATWPNALTVTSSPSIVSVSPITIDGGATRQMTISGRNFETGASLEVIPSAGLTLSGMTVDNTGQITFTVAAAQHVGPERRTLKVTNAGGGQCSVATMMDAFRVIPRTAVMQVSNDMTQCQGRSGKLMVAGENFMDPSGATLVASASLGSDVSIDSLLVRSATQMEVGYTINAGATLGMRSLVVDSNVQGALPAAWADALMVTSSPSITTVSPRSLQIGEERQVSITGLNFTVNGASVALNPSAGMHVSAISVVNSGLILATIKVDEAVQTDPRTITVTNNDGGSCAVATLSAALQIVDPPHVTSTSFPKSKTSLRIVGMNFHPSIQAYVGGSTSPFPRIKVNKNSTITLSASKKVMKAMFPKGVTVTVQLVNPDDGGKTYVDVTR